MHFGRRPRVAARTRLARSGSSKIRGADVGLKTAGDQRHDVHERFSRLAAFGRQMADLFQSQDVVGSASADHLRHSQNSLSRNTRSLRVKRRGFDMNGQPRKGDCVPN